MVYRIVTGWSAGAPHSISRDSYLEACSLSEWLQLEQQQLLHKKLENEFLDKKMAPAAMLLMAHGLLLLWMLIIMLKEIKSLHRTTTPMELNLLISIWMIGVGFMPIRLGVGCGMLIFLVVMGILEDGQLLLDILI